MRRCQPSPPSVPSFSLPQLCRGTGRGQPPGTPALLGKLGPPFPRAVTCVAGAGALCPWEAASEGSRKSDLSCGGERRELCASLSSVRRGSAQDSLQLCHQYPPAGNGEGFKQDRKSNEQPKAQPGIVHLGPGSVPSTGTRRFGTGSVHVHDRPPLF